MEGYRRFIGMDDLSIEMCRMLLAEFMGTFFYVFIGVTSSVSLSLELMTSVVPVAIAFGLASSSISHVVHKASGAHLNPAVSVSCLVVGEMSILKCVGYIIAQCAGSCVAAFIMVKICTVSAIAHGNGITQPLYVGAWAALIIETCITFFVVMIFKSMADPMRDDLHLSGPFSIGLAVIAGHLVGYQFSGASMNPARSFGPALINMDFRYHWIYWVGPMLGATLGGIYYYFGVQEHESVEVVEE